MALHVQEPLSERQQTTHILNHDFIAVLWHRELAWHKEQSTRYPYQLFTTFKVSLRLSAVCCQGLQNFWTPSALPDTWICATLCWTVFKISRLLANHFPCSGCFSFSIRLYSQGLRSGLEGGHFNTSHCQYQRTFLTMCADGVVTVSRRMMAFSTTSGCFYLTAWCRWYCRNDL
jgi:hypothetical protein